MGGSDVNYESHMGSFEQIRISHIDVLGNDCDSDQPGEIDVSGDQNG
jgi:hypothetical protein